MNPDGRQISLRDKMMLHDPIVTLSAPMPRRAATGRLRLMHVVLALVLSFGLLISGAIALILLHNAKVAIEEETTAAFEAAQVSLALRIPPPFTSSDSLLNAAALAAEFDAMRHVAARLIDNDGNILAPVESTRPERDLPGWFVSLMAQESRSERFIISQYPNVLGALELSTDPYDEMDEIWEDFGVILPLLMAAGVAMIALILVLGKIMLRHIGHLQRALTAMEKGAGERLAADHRIREFADLAQGINKLADYLRAERRENGKLQKRLIDVSEAERARIASDLHDEMGPQLFALNASLMQVGAELAAVRDELPAALSEALEASSRYARAVQATARAAINDLRPMLLGHGSLDEILAEILAELHALFPAVSLQLEGGAGLLEDELAELSACRFVRESALNAIRHGKADQVVIHLSRLPGARPQLSLKVSDNGRGLGQAPLIAGHGITGIQDRSRALGARYIPPYRLGSQTLTELQIPCH